MRARLRLRERHVLDEDTFGEIVVWHVPEPVRGSRHGFRYRLALIVKGVCVLRYDNEAGKADHRHIGELETEYAFSDPATLLADFWSDVERARRNR